MPVTEETETYYAAMFVSGGDGLTLFALFPPVNDICLCVLRVFVVNFGFI
jgi:hypothetical protein